MKIGNFACGAGGLPPSPNQPAGDRTTGISAAQGAVAAAQNILSGNIGEGRAAAMALNFIEAHHGDKTNRLPQHVGLLVGKTRSQFRVAHYTPARMPENDVSHWSVVGLLLSPSESSVLLALVGDKLTNFYMENHSSALDSLRDVSVRMKDGLYRLVMKGNLAVALDGITNGQFPEHDRKEVVEVIQHRAKCLAVRTAHDLVQVFGDHTTRPYGDHFAGFKTNLLMGHTVMATLAAPAAAIQRFVAAAKRGDFDDLNDEAMVARLVQLNVLPPGPDGLAIMRIAKRVLRALRCRNRNYGSQSIFKILEDSTKAAARLNRGDMKRENLSQRGFAEHRTGLTSSEGASFIALELLQALNQFDEIVDAIVAGQPLPERKASKIPKSSISIASVILRTESHSDKNATTVRKNFDANPVKGPDPDHKSGRIPMVSMLEKMHHPDFEDLCREAFGIDALVWFRR